MNPLLQLEASTALSQKRADPAGRKSVRTQSNSTPPSINWTLGTSVTASSNGSRKHFPLRLTGALTKTDHVLGHKYISTNLKEWKPYSVCSQTTVQFNQKSVTER